MAGVEPSRWAVAQFGDHAPRVMRHVVAGLKRGQRAARAVQTAAQEAGATDRRPFGSMWAARYQFIVEQFELASLPGYEPHKPKGASYHLAVISGRVLIPFRHAASITVPINPAKLINKIPWQVSRQNGVSPMATLFDADSTDGGQVFEEPTVAEAAEAARAENLTVVYVAYVANADSDDVLAAWWGTPISLEDDGTMLWEPERLDMSIAVDESGEMNSGGLRASGAATNGAGFAQGEIPDLHINRRSKPVEQPSSEPDPTTPDVEDDNA